MHQHQLRARASWLVLGGLVLLSATSPAEAAAHDCPDRALLLETAEDSLVSGRLDDSEQLEGEIESAFACGPPADPVNIARLFNVKGVRLFLQSDTTASTESFAAAARISPNTWNTEYGAELRGVRDEAATAARGAGGTLSLEPDPGDFQPALDGVELALPTPAASGLHLIQVLDTDGRSLYGQVVYLPSGQDLLVDTGPLVTRVEPRARRFPWMLVGAGVFAAGGATSGWLATRQTEGLETARTLEGLDTTFRTQKTFNALMWTGAGLSGACVSLHFAL